jgi:tRNA A-37 threonylcarbamoyl transferase component Bud32
MTAERPSGAAPPGEAPRGEPAAPAADPTGPTVAPFGDGATLPSVDRTLPTVDALPPSTTRDLVGKSIAGRYTVLEPLGSGGMSVVYVARHELLKKIVAIKLLREEIAANKTSLSRFHREAVAAAGIGDPHIVDVTDYGFTEDGDAFIVMEKLEGQDLRHLVQATGAIGIGRAVSIARQILRALSAAHGRGIVHRDLKAENVFLTQRDGHDFVKLLDFGISKILQPVEGSTAVTGTGVVMGTPQYIAPEQAHGAPDVDHRVDIYAMGVILYEMLTGSLPFTGRSMLEVVMKHVQEPPQPMRERRPDLAIPIGLERVVLKALSKKPGDRYTSAEEMLEALPDPSTLPGGFVSGALARAPASGRGRWPIVVGVAVVLVGAGAAGTYWALKRKTTLPIASRDASQVRDQRASATRPDAGRRHDAASSGKVVRITLQRLPKRATVVLDGVEVEVREGVLTLPRSESQVIVTLQAPGYETKDVTILPDKDKTLLARLRPKKGIVPKKGGVNPEGLLPFDADKKKPR